MPSFKTALAFVLSPAHFGHFQNGRHYLSDLDSYLCLRFEALS